MRVKGGGEMRNYYKYNKSNGDVRFFYHDSSKTNEFYKTHKYISYLEDLELMGNFTDLIGGLYSVSDDEPTKNETLVRPTFYVENSYLADVMSKDPGLYSISFLEYCVAKIWSREPMSDDEKLEIAKRVVNSPAWNKDDTQDPCCLLDECNHDQERLRDVYFETWYAEED